MGSSEKGYIKFDCTWKDDDFDFPEQEFYLINLWRDRMQRMNLIGVYPNGIGFGNISIRHPSLPGFIISGSSTGHLEHLDREHYAYVTGYNFNSNSLGCTGRIRASSESLSHAIIYENAANVNGVIHIHSREHWQKMFSTMPLTSIEVEYGTPAMAMEIKRVIDLHQLFHSGLIVMGGHEEGILSFGKDLHEAGRIIIENLK